MPLVAVHELEDEDATIEIYNGLDCLITREVHDNLSTLAHQAGPVYSFERALQGPVLEMVLRGFRIDPSAREEGISDLRQRMTRLSEIIDAIAKAVSEDPFGPPAKNPHYPKPKHINPESDMQLKRYFYQALKIPPIKKMDKGIEKFPMDRDTLEKLEVYFDARLMVNCILAYRDCVGQLEVFEAEVDEDWRMRTSYNIAATDTWRFSSSKSIIGNGRNLQNIEEILRYVFIADPGYKLYGIDLEQTESREVGVFCGLILNDWSYLNACESGDLHTQVCKMVWPELPWTGDKKLDRKIADGTFYREYSYRDTVKRLGHGSNYGGKPHTLSQNTKIPVPVCAAFQKRYFTAFPCLPRMHQWIATEIQTKRRLTNVFGATRDFFDRPEADETIRAAIAHMFQSATANRLNLGMWLLWRHEPEFKLLAQLHDAVYFQAKDTIPETEVARRALKHIEIPFQYGDRKFVVPGEVKCGLNWGKQITAEDVAKAKKLGKILRLNENGLRKVENIYI